jgi:protein-L-isoaspartate(D-aspartate) O-methyltransferase
MSADARKPWMAHLARPAAQKSAPQKPRPGESPLLAAGLGLTSERSRATMVARLAAAGISDQRVLNAMSAVPRHAFVDEGLASRAYEDTALPIGHHQTISQPYIVARMTELACASEGPLRILEIGTGCGYQSAVLARVAAEVYSVERIRALHDRARVTLRPMRIANLRLIYGDGLLGVPEAAPFNAMLIAAAAPTLPRPLLMQLAIGGRAVAPLGDAEQTLCLIERKSEDAFVTTPLERVRFVPLHGGVR